MADIHYIWWGNPQTQAHLRAAQNTPNAVFAGVNGVHQVRYWTWSRTFNAQLAAGITQTPIDIDGNYDPTVLMTRDDPRVWYGIGILLGDVLRTLTAYGAYSAVKDLLSLLVLYKHGGYYFDTSTVVQPADLPQFSQNLATVPGEPKVVLRGSIAGRNAVRTFDFNVEQRTAEATLTPDTGRRGGGVRTVPGIDVWAMYAPAGHESVATMIHAYLERCANLGLNRHPSRANVRMFNVHNEMTSANRAVRNQLIGNLIICSVQEGLYRWAQANDKTSADYGWGTTDAAGQVPPNCALYCPDLWLGKQHAGTWR